MLFAEAQRIYFECVKGCFVPKKNNFIAGRAY